jgi:hypothetical protein
MVACAGMLGRDEKNLPEHKKAAVRLTHKLNEAQKTLKKRRGGAKKSFNLRASGVLLCSQLGKKSSRMCKVTQMSVDALTVHN